MNRIKTIQSLQIRQIAEHLYDQGISITFFGKAWSGCTNNWIYFDTYLDLDDLKSRFNLDENLEVHENRDPKSGLERGFIDKVTGEAIMGKLKLD
ncbi:MAG: hypothetical protein DWQ02_12580 [Bacteroidetes bacterium]|nr:MAG: hypothetical protein DWQ02_12580 [Bacteroidota bacterium]